MQSFPGSHCNGVSKIARSDPVRTPGTARGFRGPRHIPLEVPSKLHRNRGLSRPNHRSKPHRLTTRRRPGPIQTPPGSALRSADRRPRVGHPTVRNRARELR
ncbi:hypothetical protein EXIGLDRAFT_87359 [Exidia glandulosa HHB12029]|uniref:Uncharacterized protein n=1 Tax=Exidia glandulosa HHB12029 TaxID=1314781 RepID=A0A166AH40_EXIGL|nr:hypothetical protein EXIGLDRAFT_87359 [Exidia glandulosa HHB12029]